MVCDESLYRQYLNGDDAGLEALMKKYGDYAEMLLLPELPDQSGRCRQGDFC